jgi:hypothetical protein
MCLDFFLLAIARFISPLTDQLAAYMEAESVLSNVDYNEHALVPFCRSGTFLGNSATCAP